MCRNYTIEDVLAYTDIPLPEEDDLSDDDDFDGYIDGEIEDKDDNRDDGNGNDSDGNDSDGMTVMGMTVKVVVMGKTVKMMVTSKTMTMEVLRFQSILGIQVAHKTWQTKIQ